MTDASAVPGQGSHGTEPHETAASAHELVTTLLPAHDRLLDPGEVATRLGLCRDTVYRLCESGELAHHRVCNRIRVAASAVAEFFERNQQGARRVQPKKG